MGGWTIDQCIERWMEIGCHSDSEGGGAQEVSATICPPEECYNTINQGFITFTPTKVWRGVASLHPVLQSLKENITMTTTSSTKAGPSLLHKRPCPL